LAIALLLTVPQMGCIRESGNNLPIAQAGEPNLNSDKIAQLQSLIDRVVKTENIPGIVLYVSTPDTTWSGAAGVANLANRKPVKTSDRFRIGSITKTFVAVVILQLYEAGEISLEDAIADWLPEEISEQLANSEEITIRQLLNHTSGLADYLDNDDFFADFEEEPGYEWTAEEVLEYVYLLETVAEPDTEFYYANTNYILLEAIVEAVTGNTLAQELRDRIYTPLGLDNTFMEIQENIPDRFVSGYDDWDGDGKRDNVTDLEPWGLGDGGIISTASDLATFLQALFLKEELLEPETLDEMLEFIDDGEGDEYGLGLSNIETDWGQAWGHSGSTGGFLSTIMYLPDYDISVVVLTNCAEAGDPDESAETALKRIVGAVVILEK